MASLDSFRRYVLLETPGCPLPLVDNAIVSGCRQFCKDTRAFVETSSFNTVAGVSAYDLDAPSNHEAFAALEVRIDGVKINPLLDGLNDSHRLDTDQNRPVRYEFQRTTKELILYPIPDGAYAVLVRAVHRPVIDAGSVDDALLEHQQAIADFAKFELMSADGQPWSKPQRAVACLGEYSKYVADFRVDLERAGTNLPMRVKPRSFR